MPPVANTRVSQILLKRGNTAVSQTYVGPLGEITIDTDLDTLRIHDGQTPGGFILSGGAENGVTSANLLSVENKLSNLVSVVSAAQLSTQISLNNEISVRTATSAALESHVNTVSAAVAYETLNRISADTALSNRISATSAELTSAKDNLQSAINVVSNAVSVVSAAGVSTNNRISTISSNLTSIDTKLSNAISVVSNALSAEIANRISAINAISNSVSVTSADLASAKSNIYSAINAISNAVSVTSADLVSVKNNLASAINGLSTIIGQTDRLVAGDQELILGTDGVLTLPGDMQKLTDLSIVVGESVVNFAVEAVDSLTIPPSGVWRLFFNDSDYPTIGATVQIGDTVTTSWETPITATIVDIQQDSGSWQIHVDQDITVGFNDFDTVTFSSVLSKTWTFGTDGNLTFPDGDITIGHDPYGGPAIIGAAGKSIAMIASGVGEVEGEIGSSLIWVDSITEPTKIAGVTANNPLFAGAGDVGIVTGDYGPGSGSNIWNFSANGTLTIPGDIRSEGNINIDINLSDSTLRRWTFGTNGTTTFPSNTINPGNNQPLGIQTQSSGNAYAQMTQNSSHWEVYAEDDATAAQAAWAWIFAELPTTETPQVFIENQKGSDGSNYRWTFDSDGNLIIPNDIQDANGSVIFIEASTEAPTKTNGQLWYNTLDGRLYIRYNDVWADASPTIVPSPETYLDGLTIDDTTISKTNFPDSRSIVLDNQGHTASLKSTGELEISGNFMPKVTGTQNLGGVTMYWDHAYINEVHTILDGGGANTWLTAN